MSELIQQHGVYKLISLLAIIFSASLILILTTVPSSQFQRDVESEVKALSLLIDLDQWVDITQQVQRTYSEKYIDNGVQNFVSTALLPKGDHQTKQIIEEFKGEFILNRVTNNIHILAYQLTYRIIILTFWCFILLPYFFALIYDGYTQRRIRLYQPKQISIKGSRIWTRSIVYLIILSFSYLVIPNFFDIRFAALVPLAMLMLAGYASKKIIEHYMKVA